MFFHCAIVNNLLSENFIQNPFYVLYDKLDKLVW